MVAVSLHDTKDVIATYLKENGFSFYAAPDRKGPGSLVRKYGVGSFPTSYIIGPDGTIVDVIMGYDEARLHAALKKLGIEP